MRSTHQKLVKKENDENLLSEAGEHEMTDDINDDAFSTTNDDDDDNYEESLTSSNKGNVFETFYHYHTGLEMRLVFMV